MNNIKNLALVAGIAFTLQACNESSNKNSGTTTISADTALSKTAENQKSNTKLKPEEAAFVEKAAVGGMMEVELGNLTTQKTKNKQVGDFAKQMIKDHTQLNRELKVIAEDMGVKLPGALPAAEQSSLTSMRQMLGQEYDQNYMDIMVSDHAKTIDLFNGASRFENAQLKTFAVKTLPMIVSHHQKAIVLDSLTRIKKPGTGGDDLSNVDKQHKN